MINIDFKFFKFDGLFFEISMGQPLIFTNSFPFFLFFLDELPQLSLSLVFNFPDQPIFWVTEHKPIVTSSGIDYGR